MRALRFLSVFLGLSAALQGQSGRTTRYAEPVRVPNDRFTDSYVVYSQLLKTGPMEWRDAKRARWVIEESTVAIPLGYPCAGESGPDANGVVRGPWMWVNPHTDIEVPEKRHAEWNEVLEDYDSHCHDVLQLQKDSLKTDVPIRLLGADELQNFERHNPPPEALYSFSEVFFNKNHSLALVYQSAWSASNWVVLERDGSHWKILPWLRSFTIA